MRDLCDECPRVSGRSGDKGSRVGGRKPRRDSTEDEEEEEAEDSEETANLSDSGARQGLRLLLLFTLLISIMWQTFRYGCMEGLLK